MREFWHVGSAVCIVAGSWRGAFVLSYFTPTVGLGCRSGSYTIFFIVSLGLLIMEMTVWLLLSPYQMETPLLTRTATRLRNSTFVNRLEDNVHDNWAYLKRRASGLLTTIQRGSRRFTVKVATIFPWRNKDNMQERVNIALDEILKTLRAMNA